MGYFDALTSSSFKTARDGQRLFFPWGTLGRGYVIPSKGEFQRLRRIVKGSMVVSLPLVIVVVIWKGFVGGLAIMPLLILPYVYWAQLECRRLDQTHEKLALSESVDGQARAHSAVGLWLLEISSLAFVVAGVIMFLSDPRSWGIALASVVFFGLGALIFARMLWAKRRH